MTIAPEREHLDEISYLVAGVPYDRLPTPNEKARVLELTLQALIAYDANDTVQKLEAIEQTITEEAKNVNENLENLHAIGEWFEKSKLWENDVYVSNR